MSVLLTAMMTVTDNDYRGGRAMSNLVRKFDIASTAAAMRDCENYADRLHGTDAVIKEVGGKRVSYRETKIAGNVTNITETVTFCYEY